MMQNTGRRKSDLARVDSEFKEYLLAVSRFKSAQEKDKIGCPRITEAMYNQYKKYPELLEEIKKSKLSRRGR